MTSPPTTTMYLEGLPYTTTLSELREFLWSVGVKKAAVVDVRMSTWQDTGRSRGFAHVDLANEQALEEAVAKVDRKDLGGRFVRATKAKAPRSSGDRSTGGAASSPENPPSKTLFLRNLAYQATEDVVQDAVVEVGGKKPTSVRIPRHGSTGLSKGICYVEFATVGDAEKMMRKLADGAVLKVGGRVVQADYDTGKPRAGFKGPPRAVPAAVAAVGGGTREKKEEKREKKEKREKQQEHVQPAPKRTRRAEEEEVDDDAAE